MLAKKHIINFSHCKFSYWILFFPFIDGKLFRYFLDFCEYLVPQSFSNGFRRPLVSTVIIVERATIIFIVRVTAFFIILLGLFFNGFCLHRMKLFFIFFLFYLFGFRKACFLLIHLQLIWFWNRFIFIFQTHFALL